VFVFRTGKPKILGLLSTLLLSRLLLTLHKFSHCSHVIRDL